MGLKKKLAMSAKQQKIAYRIFSGSTLKTKDGTEVSQADVQPGETYLLYSQEGKKIGWAKMPTEPGQAGVGWINLPAYLKLPEPPEMPKGFEESDFLEADMDDYDFDEEEQTYIDDAQAADEREIPDTPEDEKSEDDTQYE